jgi:hypothetical protein
VFSPTPACSRPAAPLACLTPLSSSVLTDRNPAVDEHQENFMDSHLGGAFGGAR